MTSSLPIRGSLYIRCNWSSLYFGDLETKVISIRNTQHEKRKQEQDNNSIWKDNYGKHSKKTEFLLCRNSHTPPTNFWGGGNSLIRVVIHLFSGNKSIFHVLWGPWSCSGKLLISRYLIPLPRLKWASESKPSLVANKLSLVAALKRLRIKSGFNLKPSHSFLV